MGFFSWIKKKMDLKSVFPSINTITKEYQAYKKEHPSLTYDEAPLHVIRWRLNRAFFGSEKPSHGSQLYGEFPDAEIIKILKECGSYDQIEKAASFVAGIELKNAKQKERGLNPSLKQLQRFITIHLGYRGGQIL